MYAGLDYYKYENVFLFIIAYAKISTLQRYERFVGNCTFAINKLGSSFFVKNKFKVIIYSLMTTEVTLI